MFTLESFKLTYLSSGLPILPPTSFSSPTRHPSILNTMCLLGALGFLFNKNKDDNKPSSGNPANGPRPSYGHQNPAMRGNAGQYPMAPRPGPPPGQAPPYN